MPCHNFLDEDWRTNFSPCLHGVADRSRSRQLRVRTEASETPLPPSGSPVHRAVSARSPMQRVVRAVVVAIAKQLGCTRSKVDTRGIGEALCRRTVLGYWARCPPRHVRGTRLSKNSPCHEELRWDVIEARGFADHHQHTRIQLFTSFRARSLCMFFYPSVKRVVVFRDLALLSSSATWHFLANSNTNKLCHAFSTGFFCLQAFAACVNRRRRRV